MLTSMPKMMMMVVLQHSLQGSLENIDKVILSLQNIERIQIDSITSKEIPLDYYENDFYIQY